MSDLLYINKRKIELILKGNWSPSILPCSNVARTFLDECLAGKEETSVAPADGIDDSVATKSQNINILVTSGSLIPSLAKCLLFRLDNMIAHGNGESHSPPFSF